MLTFKILYLYNTLKNLENFACAFDKKQWPIDIIF